MARNVQIDERERVRDLGYTPREWDRLNAQDAKEKRRGLRLGLITAALFFVTLFLIYSVYYVIFRSHDYSLSLPFDKNHTVFGFPEKLQLADRADAFAEDLCVADTEVGLDLTPFSALSGGLFDLTGREVIYGKDLFTARSPASLTKIMTALVALEYGNLDDLVTVTDTAKEIEYGSSVCDIHTGDVLSLRQLLYGMIIASGNDAAMMVAEHVGGSVENFVQMMNDEALRLGATRTRFTNPHGLTDPEHYTCVYDLYLIFHEAMKNDTFMDMISRKNFYAEYRDASTEPVAVTWETTNHYFTGDSFPPDGVIIYGGKTGTTEDAGGCLVILAKDLYGDPYLGVVLHANDRDVVYDEMNRLLALVN